MSPYLWFLIPVVVAAWYLVGSFVCAVADAFCAWMGASSSSKLWREPVAVAFWPLIAGVVVAAFVLVLLTVCVQALRVFADG